MNNSKREQIDQYLNGQLAGQDLQEFKQHLASDKSFAQAVQIRKKLNASLKDTNFMAFMKTLGEVEKKLNDNKN